MIYSFRCKRDQSLELLKSIEIWRLKLHHLIEISVSHHVVHHVLVNIWVYLVLMLLLRFIGSVSLPSPFLLGLILHVLVPPVFALETDAVLAAFHPFLKTEAVFLLAMRLLASTEDEVLHAGVMGINLLVIM